MPSVSQSSELGLDEVEVAVALGGALVVLPAAFFVVWWLLPPPQPPSRAATNNGAIQVRFKVFLDMRVMARVRRRVPTSGGAGEHAKPRRRTRSDHARGARAPRPRARSPARPLGLYSPPPCGCSSVG